MTKLSIITINYNNKDGLQNTIDSVIGQTWREFEWIVIDGGSTDGSKELIEMYQKYFSYWCSEPDRGVYNAMNKGIAYAKGKYVIFLNSGDVFAFSTTLKTVFSLEYDTDIIFGYMMRKTLDGIPHNIPSMKPTLYWEDFYFDTLPHQSSYIRRDLFTKLGGYDETYPRLADWKWFLNAIVVNKATYTFLPNKLSVYECGGISEDEHWKEDLIRLRQEMYPSFIPKEDFGNLRDLHIILKHGWSRFLYRIVRKLSRIYFKHTQNKNINYVRFKE